MYVEGANPSLSAILVNSIFPTSLLKKVMKFVASSVIPLRLCSVLMLPQSGTCQQAKLDGRKEMGAISTAAASKASALTGKTMICGLAALDVSPRPEMRIAPQLCDSKEQG